MSWEDFTNDDDEDLHRNQSMMSSSLLPSSLRDIIDESSNPNQMFMPNMNQDVSVPHSFDRRNLNFPFIGSAPIPNYGLNQDEVMFQGQIDPDERFHTNQYFQVMFHKNRSSWFFSSQTQQFKEGDFVLTEADRGYDIGKVISVTKRPSLRDIRTAKKIVRIAHQHEIDQLPQKAEREAKALALCRQKAAQLGLPMEITGAEFQFDGKKLTFYYTADVYVDFRILVRTLFKVFGTRIWMCCLNEIPQ